MANSVRGQLPLRRGATFEVELASRAPWDELPDDGLPRYDAGKPGDP